MKKQLDQIQASLDSLKENLNGGKSIPNKKYKIKKEKSEIKPVSFKRKKISRKWNKKSIQIQNLPTVKINPKSRYLYQQAPSNFATKFSTKQKNFKSTQYLVKSWETGEKAPFIDENPKQYFSIKSKCQNGCH